MGTMLQRHGLKLGEIPELLAITNPDLLTNIHRQYIEAGTEIVYANTFGANRRKMQKTPYTVADVVSAAIAAAKKACIGTSARVALDIGPLGELLEPMGTLPFETAVDMFAEIVDAGVNAGADLICIETMTDLYEAKAALLAAKEHSDLPILASMSFEAGGRTFTGCTIPSMARTLEGLGADAIGLNCSQGPKQLLPLFQELCRVTTLPVIAKPNAGLPDPVDGHYDLPPEEFARTMVDVVGAGVSIVGGCCGTTEEHIAALKATLKDAEYVRPAPECLDLLPAATEKEAFFLPADATHGAVLTADGDLEDKLSDAMDDEWPMVALKLASWADVDALADYQYMIRKPLCLICDDAELLEAGLRAYQGRALYEGNLTEDALAPLVEKYGLLV